MFKKGPPQNSQIVTMNKKHIDGSNVFTDYSSLETCL